MRKVCLCMISPILMEVCIGNLSLNFQASQRYFLLVSFCDHYFGPTNGPQKHLQILEVFFNSCDRYYIK